MFLLVHIAATLGVAIAAGLTWLRRDAVWFLVILALLPLANIYVGGLCLFLSLLAMSTLSSASERGFAAARWFFLLWIAWAIWAMAGMALNGTGWRQLFQSIEFLFYGLVAWQFAVLCDTDSALFVRILAECVCGAVALAALGILAAIVSGGSWPAYLLGRNEAAFYLVTMGVVPALYLLARPTWLVRFPSIGPVLLASIALCVYATIALEARAAFATVVALIGFFITYRLSGRQPVITAWVGGLVGIAGLVGLFLSGALLDTADLEGNFSNLERLSLLQACQRLFLERPWFGWGWGTIDALIPFVPETVLSYPHPHNFLGHFAVELGAMGIFLYGAFTFRPLFRAHTLARRGFKSEALFCVAATAALLLLGMTGVLFYGASRALPVIMLIAMVEALPLRSWVGVDASSEDGLEGIHGRLALVTASRNNHP